MATPTQQILGKLTAAGRTYTVHRDERGAAIRNTQNKPSGIYRIVAGTPLILHSPRAWDSNEYRAAVDTITELLAKESTP